MSPKRNRLDSRRLRFGIEKLESRWVMTAELDAASDLMAEGEGSAVPDFHIVDINPASARFNQTVSPRDYLQQVSAWYFTHST